MYKRYLENSVRIRNISFSKGRDTTKTILFKNCLKLTI